MVNCSHPDEIGSTLYDPFKKRVLQAVSKGLTMASIDHQAMMEENIVTQTISEQKFNEYPYKPDLIFGYKNKKVLLRVIPETQTMFDT